MGKKWLRFQILMGLLLFAGSVDTIARKGMESLYEYKAGQPRWSSPENKNGCKGTGAMENPCNRLQYGYITRTTGVRGQTMK